MIDSILNDDDVKLVNGISNFKIELLPGVDLGKDLCCWYDLFDFTLLRKSTLKSPHSDMVMFNKFLCSDWTIVAFVHVQTLQLSN